MAPLPPYCIAKKQNGERRRHKPDSLPCLYCGLDPVTFVDSEDEDETTNHPPPIMPTASMARVASPEVIDMITDTELESTPTQSQQGSRYSGRSQASTFISPSPVRHTGYSFAPPSRRTTANSLQPIRENLTRLAMDSMTRSSRKMKQQIRDNAGDPPLNINSNSYPALNQISSKKDRPAQATSQFKVYHYVCVGIVERVCYKSAFEKECQIAHILSRSLACMLRSYSRMIYS